MINKLYNKQNFNFREQLQYNIQKNIHKLEIDFEDLDAENKNLSDVLIHKPGTVIPLVSLIFLIFGAFFNYSSKQP